MTIRITIALLMVGMLFMTAAPRAVAEGPDSEESVTSEYTRERGGIFSPLIELFTSLAQQEVITDSPSGCVMNVDDPHGSHQQSGYIHGHVRAQCNNRVPVMTHTATLEKRVLFGWDELLSSTGIFSRTNVQWGRAVASYRCEGGDFRVRGRGTIIDVDQIIYTARAYGRTVDDPCDG